MNGNLKTGDKVQFCGVKEFWFVNMMDNGHKLKKFKIYTIGSVEIASSSTIVTLKETGDLEYNAEWFKPYV